MAARDNVLFQADIASGTSAGTVVPLSLVYGVENVRNGYGTPVLKSIRTIYAGGYSSNDNSIDVTIKNSNWIDSVIIHSQKVDDSTCLDDKSLAYMPGRDKVLAPNTSWTIEAKVLTNTTAAANIYVLFEIEYSDVPGINPEQSSGSPVSKQCINASVTGAKNTLVSIGTFDNLLQGVQYVLAEASVNMPYAASSCNFIVIEGFSTQRGLVRILPCRNYGTAEQIKGSVILTKQTYNVAIIRSAAMSATAITVTFEFVADKN